MSERYNPKAVAEATMATLKDFQKETVNRVIELYKSGRNRVLIADEVGLGKTVVARGVIARFAELREEEKDDLVSVYLFQPEHRQAECTETPCVGTCQYGC